MNETDQINHYSPIEYDSSYDIADIANTVMRLLFPIPKHFPYR